MKLGKSIAIAALGATAALAYQKYKKPVMKKVEKTINKTKRQVNDKLEDMK